MADLSIFISDGISVVQALATPAVNGQPVTAEDRLAQRFILELMTDRGSILYEPERGTDFIKTLSIGLMNTWEIIGAFSSALLIIRRNLTAEESDSDPANERFAGASLQNVEFADDKVFLEINIASQAGVINKVNLPLVFKD